MRLNEVVKIEVIKIDLKDHDFSDKQGRLWL